MVLDEVNRIFSEERESGNGVGWSARLTNCGEV
jgi:hypothetical protein